MVKRNSIKFLLKVIQNIAELYQYSYICIAYKKVYFKY